jgi:hypothetical protein
MLAHGADGQPDAPKVRKERTALKRLLAFTVANAVRSAMFCKAAYDLG